MGWLLRSGMVCLGVALWTCAANETSRLSDDDDGPPAKDDEGEGSAGDDAIDPGGGGAPPSMVGDPTTCEEAAEYKTYIGCDFWPTVVANSVWSVFDYAVVVANAGIDPADVTVEKDGAVIATATIAPDSLETIYLPWVDALKGPGSSVCSNPYALPGTVRADGGAYHLTSTVPVTAYQFSPLEYQPVGGPPGKDWSSCPASQCSIDCFSYSNDASLLLPSTAMTGNYRITGSAGWPSASMGPYFAITGTQDATSVKVFVSGTGSVMAGSGVVATPGGGVIELDLDAGDVVQIVGEPTADLSGSLVQASAPVQVIAGMPCVYMPSTNGYCDHIEESVLPAETLGERYFVTPPSGPHGTTYGHIVRLYGNVDGTTLSFPSGTAPPNAPTTIHAGQVIDLGVVTQSFEIAGDNAFAVATFMLAASLVDAATPATEQMGDPSQSAATAVEQFRTKYVFLAPSDYAESYVDIVQPLTASVSLDGAPISATPQTLGSGFGLTRVALPSGGSGAHVLEASEPVGIQVIGYGKFTSYQYPGGLNLALIAPPPDPPH